LSVSWHPANIARDMPTPLEVAVARATERFARELLEVFRDAVLGDVNPLKQNAAPRAARKATNHHTARGGGANVASELMAALKKSSDGLSSEQLQKITGRAKREVFPTLTKLLETKAIRKTGQKRATRYFAA
jgi:hypothetical protein